MTSEGKAKRTRRSAPAHGAVDSRAVLDAASHILVTQGQGALSMRRVAAEAGTSTMVLYTRFGSRDGLIEQLLIEGFTRFARELAGVSHPDPFENLRLLGQAYRQFARENPTYFPLMWAPRPTSEQPPCDPVSTPSPALQAASQRSFASLVQAVTRVLAALDRPAREVEPMSVSVWSTVHGFVSLELSGVFPKGAATDDAYARTLRFIEHALRHPAT